MSRQLLINGELFDGDRRQPRCAVVIEDGAIASISAAAEAPADADETIDLDGLLLAPGLIDLQVNGGGGVLFNDAPSAESLQQIIAAHRAFGTTACLPTLISDDAAVMRRGIDAVSDAIGQGVAGIIGIHLEGPHLNPERCGVHDAAHMRPLDDAAFELLCSLDEGHTLVTLAPETVEANQIRRLHAAGLLVFAGHSAASYEATRQAIDSGLKGFTHLYNAMRPLVSREPGIIGAALEDPDTYVGIIADGYHVHRATLAIAIRAKPKGKTILVTDAMPSVGSANEQFALNGELINVENGRCVTADGALAGSNIGMIDAVRYVSDNGIVDIDEALRMASSYPAAALGIDDSLGFVRPGYGANLIALDGDLNVVHSWIAGDGMEHG